MEYSKKLNLLTREYKDKYANKYIMAGFFGALVILGLVVSAAYVNLGLANYGLKKLVMRNTEYQNKQAKIVTLQETIVKNKDLLSEYQMQSFPFYAFMKAVESQKPEGLTLISVDSADRLKEETASVENAASQPKSGKEMKSEVKDPAAKSSDQDVKTEITYQKDLSGEKLIVRGYSTNPSDVAAFLYNISQLPYISAVELKAIEEHTVNGTQTANIFEVVLSLK